MPNQTEQVLRMLADIRTRVGEAERLLTTSEVPPDDTSGAIEHESELGVLHSAVPMTRYGMNLETM